MSGAMTEADLLAAVIELAEKHQVLWFHDFDPRRDPPGFPDLVLAGLYHLAFWELKDDYKPLSPHQTEWRYRLLGAGTDFGIRRPADFESGLIEREIKALNTP